MRDDEFAAGFWYYLPHKFGIDMPRHSWERFEGRNVDGFRNMGFRLVRSRAERKTWRAEMFAEP